MFAHIAEQMSQKCVVVDEGQRSHLTTSGEAPTRDQRLTWAGDTHPFGPPANFLYNTRVSGGAGIAVCGRDAETGFDKGAVLGVNPAGRE